MCNKYRFIADIENKKVTDYLSYCHRLQKVYLIFGILAVVNLISTFKKEDHVVRLLQLLGIVCYAGIISCFLFMDTIKPNDRAMKGTVSACLGLLSVNSAGNLTSFIYLCVAYFTWTLLYSLLSLFLQLGTFYIFYHFRLQVDKELQQGDGDMSGLQPSSSAPVIAVPIARPDFGADKV
jgi:hypothetical protein